MYSRAPQAALHGVGIENVRADIVRIVRLNPRAVQLRSFVAQNVARKQHAGGLASDTAGADLAVFYVHKILHGEVFAAQGKARGLVAEKTAHYVVL